MNLFLARYFEIFMYVLCVIAVCNEVAKVMFLHHSVLNGGGSASVHVGMPAPGSRHLPRDQGPPWDQAPPWNQAPAPPGPGTPQQTATVADGRHPTGMHSCIVNSQYFGLFLGSQERSSERKIFSS